MYLILLGAFGKLKKLDQKCYLFVVESLRLPKTARELREDVRGPVNVQLVKVLVAWKAPMMGLAGG